MKDPSYNGSTAVVVLRYAGAGRPAGTETRIMTVRSIARAITVLAPLLLAGATPALAQMTGGFARESVYVGVAGMFDFTLDGVTFDGSTYYEAETTGELFILPKLDKQNLVRYLVGFRARPFALEFSYDRTRHDATFLDLKGDAVVQAVNVDAKFFWLTDGRVQPHGVVGMSFPWLTVEDGSLLEPDQGDATFRGEGLNLEAGVTVFPHPRVGVSVGYSYRFFWFSRVKGVGDETFELDPRFRDTAGSVIVMGLFTF
jgi:hypothetical protein